MSQPYESYQIIDKSLEGKKLIAVETLSLNAPKGLLNIRWEIHVTTGNIII